MSVEEVITGHANEQLQQFITSVQDKTSIDQINQMENVLSSQYTQLEGHLHEINVNLNLILEKNANYHKQQFDYLRNKIKEQVEQKHQVKINQYTRLQNELNPFGGLQERNYNPYMYLNEFGPKLINEMIKSDIELNTQHNVLYL